MAKKQYARFNLEKSLQGKGYRRIAGVDEVGRGCLAGPVCAAAVVLDAGVKLTGIRDSKLLTANARERFYSEIVASSDWSVSEVSAGRIDQLNIQQASLLAMRKAVMGLSISPDYVIIDGSCVPELPFPQQPIIGGDRKCVSIAAASIVAKVTRDRLMMALHKGDPRYGFDRHKGYPTTVHLDALEMFGYSEVHRRSFRPRRLFNRASGNN